jgi:acetyl/propionyl-CoA carboxylase alpha subunit
MRPVFTAEELPEAYERCRSEAEGAFGDGAVFVEQLMVRLGFGRVIALHNRSIALYQIY